MRAYNPDTCTRFTINARPAGHTRALAAIEVAWTHFALIGRIVDLIRAIAPVQTRVRIAFVIVCAWSMGFACYIYSISPFGKSTIIGVSLVFQFKYKFVHLVNGCRRETLLCVQKKTRKK